MPSRDEDKFFGPKKGSSNRAYEELLKTYGYAEGTRIWHAMRANRKKAGKTWKPSR